MPVGHPEPPPSLTPGVAVRMLDRAVGEEVLPESGDRSTRPQHTPRALREYIREQFAHGLIDRLVETASGITHFDVPVPTVEGYVIASVPASASVQTKAAEIVLKIGIPSQLGLVDGEDNELPGMFILGELQLAEAQAQAHLARPVDGTSEIAVVDGTPPADRHTPTETVMLDEAGNLPAHERDPATAPVKDKAKAILERRKRNGR